MAPQSQGDTEHKLFKDWFDERAARSLAEQLRRVRRSLDVEAFVREATDGLDALEMMDRVRQFSAAIRTALPGDVARAFAQLGRSLPKILPDAEAVTDGWLQWPVGQFIADCGAASEGLDTLDEAMDLMVELTQRYTAEFAVRPYVQRAPGRVIGRFAELVDHPSEHVRRWCSEGLRPRLPWGARLDEFVRNPKPILPILEALKDDPSEYVRRSVANTLNDIAKDHPALVVKTAKRWWKGASLERQRLVRHALRTRVKAGDPAALAVLGFGPPRCRDAHITVAPDTVGIGGSVQLSAEFTLDEAANLVVDLAVLYVKKNGSTSRKVFKWKNLMDAPAGPVALTRTLALVPRSIRPLYAGTHGVELQINGQVLAQASFELR